MAIGPITQAQRYPSFASKIQPQTKPMPVQQTPPVIRERYSEDPAVAEALAEMNAYAGLGKNRART